MALIFFDGFDAADFNLGKYNSWGASNDIAPSTMTRFGTGLSLGTIAAATGNSAAVRKDFPPVAKVIIGYATFADRFTDSSTIAAFYGDTGTLAHLSMRFLTSGSIQLWRGGTIVATSPSGVIRINAWHYIEVSATINDTTGNIVVRVDGTQVLTFTGDTKNAGVASTIDRVDVYNGTTGANGWLMDDFYICDDTGAAPWNTFLGDVRVQTVKPNGAGSSTQLTPVGSGSNWQNVDEIPASAADYNYSTTPGHRDLYTMEDVGIGTVTVFGVQVTAFANKTDTTTRQVKPLLKSGATVYPGAAKTLSVTPGPVTTLFQTNPATSAQWTPAEVNAIEAGVEVV